MNANGECECKARITTRVYATRITAHRIDVSRVVVVGKMNQTQALGENLRRALALDAAA